MRAFIVGGPNDGEIIEVIRTTGEIRLPHEVLSSFFDQDAPVSARVIERHSYLRKARLDEDNAVFMHAEKL